MSTFSKTTIELLIACAIFVATGCASLDPAADIGRAQQAVEQRAEVAAAWDLPWDENGGVWDGESPLTADTAARLALRNNREIRRQVESIAASRADFVQAHLLPNPVINLALGFPLDGSGGSPGMAGVVQQLAWLWTRPLAIDAAEAELRATVLAVSDAALSLVAEVRGEHANVFFAERAAEIQRENVDLIERSLALIRARREVGEASRLDENRIELDFERARTMLIDLERDLLNAKRTLLGLIGRADASAEWVAVWNPPPLYQLVGEGRDRDETFPEAAIIALAESQRLDIASARANVAGMLALVELAERGALPDVSAGARLDRNFMNRKAAGPSVSISPSVFDDNRAQIALAESMLEQAILEAEQARETAITEARRAWVDMTAEAAAAAAYKNRILALAENNLDLAQQSYEAGEADLTVFLEAQRQLNDARLALLLRERSLEHAIIELRRAVGGSFDKQPPAEYLFNENNHTEDDS